MAGNPLFPSSPRRRGSITPVELMGLWNMDPRLRGDDGKRLNRFQRLCDVIFQIVYIFDAH
jgi:hypothetical protein